MYTANLDNTTRDRLSAAERRAPRFLLSVPVTLYRYSAAGPLLAAHGLSIDISKQGVGAVVCGPPHVGETIVVNVQLVDAVFEGLAVVRHSNSIRSGFEFVHLPVEVQQKIESSSQKTQVCPWPANPFFRKMF